MAAVEGGDELPFVGHVYDIGDDLDWSFQLIGRCLGVYLSALYRMEIDVLAPRHVKDAIDGHVVGAGHSFAFLLHQSDNHGVAFMLPDCGT